MNRRRGQRGATLVEAALTLLILFMFLDGVLEFGRAYNIYQIATNAAREGARYAVAPAQGTSTLPTSGQVQVWVNNFLASGGVQGATVTVSTATNTVNSIPLTYTTVTVSAPYSLIVPTLLFGNNNITQFNMTTNASMRNETN